VEITLMTTKTVSACHTSARKHYFAIYVVEPWNYEPSFFHLYGHLQHLKVLT